MLREHGYGGIADAIADDKLRSIQALERLGLPRYRTNITPITDFLSNPQTAFSQLDLDSYMVVLNPARAPKLERKRKFGVTKDEVPEFITKSLEAAEYPDYDVIMQESFIHCYGGNLVCSANGLVLMELIEGEFGHNDLVVARKNPEFTMQRDPFTGLFRAVVQPSFGEIDSDFQAAISKTILSVPHHTNSTIESTIAARRLEFEPGYYEFYLDRRTASTPLEPFFIDYQDSPLFQPAA